MIPTSGNLAIGPTYLRKPYHDGQDNLGGSLRDRSCSGKQWIEQEICIGYTNMGSSRMNLLLSSTAGHRR